MAFKHNDQCIQKAANDEPIFVLRAKDKLAPATVRAWAMRLADLSPGNAKIAEAWELAEQMEDWQKINGCKLPD